MARISATEAGSANMLAFLDLIAWSEIGPALLAETDDGYNVLVGSMPNALKTFPSYAKHPDLLDAQLNSTAAGRYQFIWPTWRGLTQMLKFADFSPVNQDRGAIELVKECGGVEPVEAGNIALAIERCNRIWASLPGANYGQPEHKLTALLAAYAQQRGMYG